MKILIKEAFKLTGIIIKDYLLFAYFLGGFIVLLAGIIIEGSSIITWIKAMIIALPFILFTVFCVCLWSLYLDCREIKKEYYK